MRLSQTIVLRLAETVGFTQTLSTLRIRHLIDEEGSKGKLPPLQLRWSSDTSPIVACPTMAAPNQGMNNLTTLIKR